MLPCHQLAVIRELLRVEIQSVRGLINETLGLQTLDQGDLLRDVIRGSAQDIGGQDVQVPAVGQERLGIEFRDLPRGLALARGPDLHLILALVALAGEVSHVGDVHHAARSIAEELQGSHQDVLEHIGAVVADVLVVVDRRPAGVEADLRRVERREVLLRPRQAVVEAHSHRSNPGTGPWRPRGRRWPRRARWSPGLRGSWP